MTILEPHNADETLTPEAPTGAIPDTGGGIAGDASRPVGACAAGAISGDVDEGATGSLAAPDSEVAAADEIADQPGLASSPARPAGHDGALPLAPLAELSDPAETPETDDANDAEAEALEAATWSHENRQSPYDRATRIELQRLNGERQRIRQTIKVQLEIQSEAPERRRAAQEATIKAHKELEFRRAQLVFEREREETARQRELGASVELRRINAQLWRTAFPQKAVARDRAKERAAARAAAAAAETAREEAYLDEFVPFTRTYTRQVGRRDETLGWATSAPCNRNIMVRRRRIPALEAEHAAALAWVAKLKRDELADEYEAELRTNGRQTWFHTPNDRNVYMASWGRSSEHGKAYIERQTERGLATTDPIKIKR